MARANRHHMPGHIWHITHRCHKKVFLLKFARDRKRWIQWLFEAKKRYRLDVLNYTITCNHIHLLVVDGEREVIPKSLQLVAGKTAQEFNRRKARVERANLQDIAVMLKRRVEPGKAGRLKKQGAKPAQQA